LEEYKRKENFRKARRVYRDTEDSTNNPVYLQGKDLLKYSKRDKNFVYDHRARVQSVAYKLMEKDNPAEFILGAELYEALHKGGKAIPKLKRAVERAAKKGILDKEDKWKVERFIARNVGERQPSEGGLEGRTMVFIGSILGGIVLSIYSLTTTGNVTGNLIGTSQGLLGLTLFIAGIAGLVFGKK